MKRAFAFLMLSLCLFGEVVLTISKTPYEVITCSMDFTQVVGTDTMTLTSVTATNMATNTDVTSQVIATSPVPAIVLGTDKVAFAVQGGVVGSVYRISVKVVDSTTGNHFDGQMMLNITY